LNHTITDGRDTKRSLASPGFGIITRRTGSGRYAFETSSSRKPTSHASRPAASICAKSSRPRPERPRSPKYKAMSYRLRSSKSALGFRRFPLRGLDKVHGEWRLVTMAWNIKRMLALNPA
jgi:hypothetical protein